MPEDPASDAVIRIRRYPNRRFYDSTRSRHVKLEEIHDLVREGRTVEVTDSTTGRDITSRVLAQIMIDQDAAKMEVFPAPLMHLIIRSNESFVGDFVDQYFSQALQLFLQSRSQFEEQFKRATDLSSVMPPTMDWAKQMWGMFGNSPWAGMAKAKGDASANPPGESPAVAELLEQLGKLQEELEQLKQEKNG